MCRYCYTNTIKPASSFTRKYNLEAAKALGLDPLDNTTEELRLASEKCIYPAQDLELTAPDGHVIWSVRAFDFYKEKATPDTIHPSLWLNGKGNSYAGVFEVIKNAIYQVRGFDISNLTIIRGKTGWIVQDALSTVETASAALELLEKALGEPVRSKVRAVIISHSHGDHFGGIRGIVKEEDVGPVSQNKIPVYVPAGFDEACVKENIFAGTAMSRRGQYQFGSSLKPGAEGLVSTGLGLGSVKGTSSFITPTDHIERDETLLIDGITVEFQLTPGTEAPAEMNNYFADYRALWMAENCTGTLHNLYPIRGAELRDAGGWAEYILEAVTRFADRSDVVFQSHNWPHFNTPQHPQAVREYLLNNAAIYKYIHDQTLLYANEGFTAKQIARKIRIPDGLVHNWYTRPYYGSLPINARAVYTKYLGFFNGNPNDIDPLTEEEEAQTFLAYAGPAEKILGQAEKDFEAGAYRRAAYAAGQVVIADPENERARILTADAFEQLGYASESSIWRNAYLQGAFELRNGIDPKRPRLSVKADLAQCMSADLLLRYIGILVDYEKTNGENFLFDLTISEDTFGEKKTSVYRAGLYAGVFLAGKVGAKEPAGKNFVRADKALLFALTNRSIDRLKNEVETNCWHLLKKLEALIVPLSGFHSFPLSWTQTEEAAALISGQKDEVADYTKKNEVRNEQTDSVPHGNDEL